MVRTHHVLEEHGRLDDVREVGTGSFDNGGEVLHRLFLRRNEVRVNGTFPITGRGERGAYGLLLDTTFDDFHRLGNEGDASRAEDQRVGLDRLTVYPE